jgi:hypothetical protein
MLRQPLSLWTAHSETVPPSSISEPDSKVTAEKMRRLTFFGRFGPSSSLNVAVLRALAHPPPSTGLPAALDQRGHERPLPVVAGVEQQRAARTCVRGQP